MTTKMKGLLKGLRYISQIFDSEKEQEMQIGYPTDVKHVAHIGWDGPSVHSPSWKITIVYGPWHINVGELALQVGLVPETMREAEPHCSSCCPQAILMNEFRTPGLSSGPMGLGGNDMQNPAIKCSSEDSSQRGAGAENSVARDMPVLPKSSRRQSFPGSSLSADCSSREPSSKPKHSRRHQSASASNSPAREKDSSNRGKLTRHLQDPTLGSEPPTLNLPDIPKRSRRKKSKDSSTGGSTQGSRSKAPLPETYTSPFSDPGSGSGSVCRLNDNGPCPTSPLKASEIREEKECSGVS